MEGKSGRVDHSSAGGQLAVEPFLKIYNDIKIIIAVKYAKESRYGIKSSDCSSQKI